MAKRFGDQDFLDEWGNAWSCGDVSALLPFYAPDARYTDVGNSVTVNGHDELRRFYRWMLAFAPDSKVLFAGARFSVPGVAFCTLADDGTIASHEDYYDLRAVLVQLNLLPAPA